jgi:hypothetical protein
MTPALQQINPMATPITASATTNPAAEAQHIEPMLVDDKERRPSVRPQINWERRRRVEATSSKVCRGA